MHYKYILAAAAASLVIMISLCLSILWAHYPLLTSICIAVLIGCFYMMFFGKDPEITRMIHDLKEKAK
jgi:hypothetical protein